MPPPQLRRTYARYLVVGRRTSPSPDGGPSPSEEAIRCQALSVSPSSLRLCGGGLLSGSSGGRGKQQYVIAVGHRTGVVLLRLEAHSKRKVRFLLFAPPFTYNDCCPQRYFLAAAANRSAHARPTPQFVSAEPGKLV
jgi:hypothetical protein